MLQYPETLVKLIFTLLISQSLLFKISLIFVPAYQTISNSHSCALWYLSLLRPILQVVIPQPWRCDPEVIKKFGLLITEAEVCVCVYLQHKCCLSVGHQLLRLV